jgi:2',3'-cyclic-nucleotide 2'-phosphodiesterase (5'-nucleotidase family)
MRHLSRHALLFIIPAILSAAIFIAGCGPEQPKPITILHTNDIHGHFVPEPASWLEGGPLVGGFASIYHYVHQIQNETGDVLLVDAGDLMTGNLICDMEYRGAEGGALIEMMNYIGYDCMVIGNHEFDKPIENARKLMEIAEFPMLCANLVDSSGNDFTNAKYEIFDYSGLKVGVIGITYHQMLGMATPRNLKGFFSTDPAGKVREIVGEIDGKTDLIIVLSHLGYDNDKALAERIENVDIIVGGHSHYRTQQPENVNGVLVVQAGSYTRNLGRLDLTVAGDTIHSYSGQLLTTFAADTKVQPELQSFIDSFAVIIDQEYGEIIGNLTYNWQSEYLAESNVGDWITDAMREATGADIAFINSGGIRKDIPAGPVKIKDIAEMLPFQNYIELFDCTGEQLMIILGENARAQLHETHGILQLSGVTYAWRKQADDVALKDVKVGGRNIDLNKTYKIASIDYVNSNHARYYTFKPDTTQNTGLIITDLIAAVVKNAGTIDSKVHNRIKRIE